MARVTRAILIQVREEALKIATQTSRKDLLWGESSPLTEPEWLALCWIKAVQSLELGTLDTIIPPADMSSVNDE